MCHNNTNIVFNKVKLTVRLTQKLSLQLNRATRTGSPVNMQHCAVCVMASPEIGIFFR